MARAILDSNGLYDISVEQVRGQLTDHYDPRKRVVKLSDPVYSSISVASIHWYSCSRNRPCTAA
jgi:Zn-dependent membrane protease YugP